MELDYTIESARGFDDTVQAVIDQTAAAGFKVQFVHDVAATLAEKGLDRERVTIIEVCNARHAHAVLAADVRIGLMLPCPIMVYADGDVVKIATMKPTLIAQFFPDTSIENVAAEVESSLKRIMERAAE